MAAMSDVVVLVADTTTQDADGYRVTEETRREVFAEIKSVGRTEFYEALRSGITASVIFSMFRFDYQDERFVEYDGVRYKVERTYRTDTDNIELTCSEVMRL